jgi:hypothetical protein
MSPFRVRTFWLSIALGMMLLPLAAAAPGAEAPKTGVPADSRLVLDPDQVRGWMDFGLREAKLYEISTVEQPVERLKLVTSPVYRRGGRSQYRILPRPVFSYESQREGVPLSGAVFLFCEGADPEIVLGLEVRRGKADQPRWHYAPASISDWEVHVALDGADVWDAPKSDLADSHGTHWARSSRVPGLPPASGHEK